MLFSGHLVNNILSQIRGAKDIVASLVSHFGSVVTTCSGDQSGPIRAMFLASKMAARAFSRYCKAQWSKYVWMKKSVFKFFNKLLFPTLSIWIVQFTVHTYDTARAVASSIIGGGGFIYSGSAQLISFEINCFYGL